MKKGLIAIKQHLSSIENLIDEIEHTNVTECNQEDMEIDIQKIDKMAKQCPFRGHFISDYDEDIVKKYIIFLASVIREVKPVEKKIKQYFFVARIINGCNITMPISEWVTKAELMELSEIQFLAEELKDNRTLLTFDVLLMISLDGEIVDEQLDYYCELLAYLSLDKKKIQDVSKACACVLKGDESALFRCAGSIRVSKLSCYLKRPIRGEVFTSLAAAGITKDTDIIIVGEKYKSVKLDLDAYEKRSIRFVECQFENVTSIRASETETMFESCCFSDCVGKYEAETSYVTITTDLACWDGQSKIFKKLVNCIYENSLFIFDKVAFCKCEFSECGQRFNPLSGGFISCKMGVFSKCSFIKCFMRVKPIRDRFNWTDFECTALLAGNQMSITDCSFSDCAIFGRGNRRTGIILSGSEWYGPNYQFLNLIYCGGGSIEGTSFSNCSISGVSSDNTKEYNFLLNTTDTMVKDNSYSNCKCQKNEGFAEWKI